MKRVLKNGEEGLLIICERRCLKNLYGWGNDEVKIVEGKAFMQH